MPEVPPATSATLPWSRVDGDSGVACGSLVIAPLTFRGSSRFGRSGLEDGNCGDLVEIALHPERRHGDGRPGGAGSARKDLGGHLHGVLPRSGILVERD